ncbi:MAG: NAD(P)H-hydrate dehydratase [Chitinispirillaceae bacterium]
MIPVLSTAQMRSVDQQAIGGDKTTGYSYMMKAGMGLYEAVIEMVTPEEQIAVVCGKGNNGGDGYVVGRMLLDQGYRVMCFSLTDEESLVGEARQAFTEYINAKGNYLRIDDIDDLEGFAGYNLIIDAILGTGITGDPHGLASEVINQINASGLPVISVDTPSGLNNDTAETGTPSVYATKTVTMGFPKIGQLFYPGRYNVGELIIRDLGYPEEIVAKTNGNLWLPTRQDISRLLPSRQQEGNKFDHGLAFIIAGSRGMSGSATMAAMASLRTGCGMVHMATPSSVLSTFANKLTEPVIHGMPETESGTLSPEGYDEMIAHSKKMDAVLIGPGLTHLDQTSALVRRLVQTVEQPVVLDADGINAFKARAEELKDRRCQLIITPHAGEWARLFPPLPQNPVEKMNRLVHCAQEYDMTIVYKGNPTIVAAGSGKLTIVPIGNSAMATAGVGDVLSGILVSLLAQHVDISDAAVLGTCLQGLAGQAASRHLSEYSVIATDLIDRLPLVFRKLSPSVAQPILPA